MSSSSRQGIASKTQHKVTVHGVINGEQFNMIGTGEGSPYDGICSLHLECTSGKLPFPIHLIVPFTSIPTYSKLQEGTVELYKSISSYELDRIILFNHPNRTSAWMTSIQKVVIDDNMITSDLQILDGAIPTNFEVESIEPVVETVRFLAGTRVANDAFIAWHKKDGQFFSAACETKVILPSNDVSALPPLQWNMSEFEVAATSNGKAIDIKEIRNTFCSINKMCKGRHF